MSHRDHCVLDVALRAGIEIDHTCGGFGTCGTCMVSVENGLEALAPREEIELDLAVGRGLGENERLACQIRPIANLVLRRGKE